jgi:hypothetical protein
MALESVLVIIVLFLFTLLARENLEKHRLDPVAPTDMPRLVSTVL